MPYLLAGLFVVALAVTQAFYGGAMRPVFALPGFALVGLCGLLGLSSLWRKNPAVPKLACILSVLAFAGWLIWRCGTSPDAWLATGYLRLILACLVSYLIFAFVVTNPIHRLVFVIGLMGLASVQEILEVWQFNHTHDSFPLPWFSEQLRIWYGPRFDTRSHGFYLNGNHLAWFLNVVGIFALSATCWGRWRITAKIVTLYIALASFAGSILTASRGGALGLAAGLTVFVVLSGIVIAMGNRHRREITLIVLLAGGLAVVGTVAVVIKSSYIVEGRFSSLLEDSYRSSLFAVALRQAELNPLYGGGAGGFSFYAWKYRIMTNDLADDIYAHNDWAQILTDFGLPALALLVLVLFLHATTGVGSLFTVLRERMTTSGRTQSHAAALLIGAISCLAVFAVQSGFDFNMQIPVNALLASACLGLVANSGITAGKSAPKSSMTVRLAGGLLTALGGAWLLVLVARAAPIEMTWLRAEDAFLTGRQKEALQIVKEGLPNTLVHPPFCRLGGLILLEANKTSDSPWERLDNTQAATRLFSRALADSPDDWKNYYLLALATKNSGRTASVEETALQSIVLNPTQASGYEFYADLLLQQGRLGEAFGVYERASQLPGATHSRQMMLLIESRIKAASESRPGK